MKPGLLTVGKLQVHGGFMIDQLLYSLADHSIIKPLASQWFARKNDFPSALFAFPQDQPGVMSGYFALWLKYIMTFVP